MSLFLAPENTPFAVSLVLLGLLVVFQAFGMGHFFPDADFDSDLPEGEMDLGGGLASMLGFGRVPLIVWLSCFLATFGLLGLSMQELIAGIFGAPFSAAAAAGATLLVAFPGNAVLVRLLAHIWPQDETTAVPIEALVGRRGRIATGQARRGYPARAIVHDLHGQAHNVMVEPHLEDSTLQEGDEVLLVRREGELFFALDGQGPIRLN